MLSAASNTKRSFVPLPFWFPLFATSFANEYVKPSPPPVPNVFKTWSAVNLNFILKELLGPNGTPELGIIADPVFPAADGVNTNRPPVTAALPVKVTPVKLAVAVNGLE
ncbi:hypothetical protein D3C86_1262020 [compost metagenome]